MPEADRARDELAVRRARASAQLLGPGAGPRRALDVVRHLLAVQAQDGPSVARALAVRGACDVVASGGWADGIVLTWLHRGTLHLCAREDWPWLLALTAPRTAATSARRLAQLGVDPERAVPALLAALDDGPLDRAGVRAALDAADVPSAGQAAPHAILAAALRGLVTLDPITRRVRPEPVSAAAADRGAMLRALGRRYLVGHAPAGPADLAHWAGVPLGDARAALDGVATATGGREPVPPRLLPAFDPYLLGWRDRSHAVPAGHEREVHPGGGIVRAVATVDGLVVGTWTKADGIAWLDGPPDDAAAAALGAAARAWAAPA